MPPTVIRGKQVLDGSIQRADVDTSTVGQALVTKLVQGTNVTLSSTGADSGTGDVTINVPTGGAGPAGLNAFNITSGSFTVPNVGATVNVTLNDASWVVVGQMVYVDGAGGGAGLTGALQVTAKTGNLLTLFNPTPAAGIPLASSSTAGLLATTSGTATDFIGGDNASHAHSTIPLDTLATTTDITTLNATSTAHGLLAKLSGSTTDFVDGTNVCRKPALNTLTGTAWTAFTATVTPGSGTITTQSSTSAYMQIGKTVFINLKVVVTTIGTASGTTTIGGLPVAPLRTVVGYVRETGGINGLGYSWTITTTSGVVTTTANANPAWTNGITYTCSLVYESV
jgi:hypothetical protein